jgi:hypothetical protein
MYHLTVAQVHTFFVGDGQWLVHNTGPCGEFAKKIDGAEILASLDNNGVFWTAIDVPSELKGQGIGKSLFTDAWNAWGEQATAIGGKWLPEMPDNMNTFNQRVQAGWSFEDSALDTLTGRQASRLGFQQVEFSVLIGNYGFFTNVEVIFR